MGICSTKSNLKKRLSDQDKKIKNLKEINEQLQNHFQKFQETEFNILLKQTTDTTNDITNLRAIFDAKFNDIEKKVDKLHNDLKKSFAENEINNNINTYKIQLRVPEMKGDENSNKENDNSLSLNFEKEKNEHKTETTPKKAMEINISNGNDLIITNKKEENKSFITLNEINMEMTQGKNENNKSIKKDTLKYLLEDEEIHKIHSGVKSTLFKNLKEKK